MKWSYKITLLYLGFASLIISMVIGSTKHKVHLVTEEYYQAEIEYDGRIERLENSRKLATPVQLAYTPDAQTLDIQFPLKSEIKGNIHLYRPSDSELDQEVALQVDATNLHTLDVADLRRGLWRVQVTWEAEGVPYYFEKPVVL